MRLALQIEEIGNMWRTTLDIKEDWDAILRVTDNSLYPPDFCAFLSYRTSLYLFSSREYNFFNISCQNSGTQSVPKMILEGLFGIESQIYLTL